ncbi:DUF1223 domain-containing protein [Nitratireductor kimnyeongensis]|uniref:DUF1223 domain-containing protein n=1 Tax=Nitratireductor kimnyeongensis TaxID=430679 RepID=A0ABW0TC96_9HYPH|nr:DUF1223 domain-containing protein [Nitratireductor kimnyeongensis]QZZ36997.1 DUF1223 domain-containing protein [Nitratireductor kimnyeongensis]
MFRLWTPGLILASALGLLAPMGPAEAENTGRPIGVVELFTSQGCNSCPPADAIFDELASRKDVIALAYHIDYWDYLGWRDALARPANSERQRKYAGALQKSSVYTPQAIINGRRDMNGANRAKVVSTLEALAGTAAGLQVELSLEDRGDSIIVSVGSLPEGLDGQDISAHLVFVDYIPQSNVEIRGGENRGRTIHYRNAVNRIQTIGMWDGTAKKFEMPRSELIQEGNGCALLLQSVDDSGLPGAILGAIALDP